MSNDERAAFEAWAAERDHSGDMLWRDAYSPESYHYGSTQAGWEAWQARAAIAQQPRMTVRLQSFPESNGKRNWTAMIVRVDEWDGLIGNCGGVTVARGELWNRVAYEAERAKFLLGERDDEPDILDYGDDIKTPEEWRGEVIGGRPVQKGAAIAQPAEPKKQTFTRAELIAAIEAERHACSIAVWMALQDALADDADDKGLDGWMREAEQRIKNRSTNDPEVAQAESSGLPRAAQWGSLYTAACGVTAKLGKDGSIQTDDAAVDSLMNALHALDGGQWMPWLMPGPGDWR